MKSLRISLLLIICITQAFATASPEFRSLELKFDDSRQTKFQKQVEKQISFNRFYNSNYTQDEIAQSINPHQEVLIFLRDHGKANLDSFLKPGTKTCWDLYDFEQFELSYISLNNISKKYIGDKSGFREYFHDLEEYILQQTGMVATEYIRSQKRHVKKLARQMSCNM